MTPDELRAFRERMGWSQRQLAAAVRRRFRHTGRRGVADWEDGRSPLPGWLDIFCAALLWARFNLAEDRNRLTELCQERLTASAMVRGRGRPRKTKARKMTSADIGL